MKVYVYNRALLHALFPAFIRAPETFLSPDTRVYFIHEQGDPLRREQELQFMYKNFLLVLPSAGLADLAITDVEDAFNYISSRFHIKNNPRLLNKLRRLPEDEQMEFFKTSIALGKWYREIFTRKEKVYKIFEAISKGQIPALAQWFRLTEEYAPQALFSAMLTFFLRMDTMQEDRDVLSDWMLTVLNKAKRQRFDIKKASMYLSIKNIDFNIRVLGFILGLRK